MKKLLIVLLFVSSLTVVAGEVNIKGYWDDQIVISLIGPEAKELFNNLDTKNIASSTVDGQTKIITKRGKSITCHLTTEHSGAHLGHECILSIDSKGRVSR